MADAHIMEPQTLNLNAGIYFDFFFNLYQNFSSASLWVSATTVTFSFHIKPASLVTFQQNSSELIQI